MLEFDTVIEKFHNSIKKEFPELTFDDVRSMVRNPFIFLRRQMAKPHLPTVRIKYWGIFRVKAGLLQHIEVKFNKLKPYLPQHKIDKIELIIKTRDENDEN